MEGPGVTDEELAALIRRAREAAVAWMRGEMEQYLALVHHARGYTLLPPTGGGPVRYEDRAGSVREAAGFFQGGAAELEQLEAHAWGDTVVLVMVERQHGRVGGLPEQDWSLRVTHVYRRDGSDWLLVHRHADPLVRLIDLTQLGALVRGEALPSGD